MQCLLRTILLKLKPGGLAFFQLPTMGEAYAFDAATYLRQPPDSTLMEMHVLPEEVVLEVLRETGCELLEAREHDCIGAAGWFSQTFLVRRGDA
jgi:hypothetical protein